MAAARRTPRTLVVDIGGSALKAAVLGARGRPLAAPLRVPTPRPATRARVLAALDDLAARLAPFERAAVGFPGVVRGGRVRSAPNLEEATWRGCPLAALLAVRWRRPVRVVNDAVLQGLGVIAGHGVELVLTLGTGLGGALFVDGRALPLEPGHLPWVGGRTYEQRVGEAARRRLGTRRWRPRALAALRAYQGLLQPDRLLVGGGNARWLPARPGPGMERVENLDALRGGARVWAGGGGAGFSARGR